MRRLMLVLVGIGAAAALCIGAFYITRALEKRTYRLDYRDEICALADEYGIDRYVVAAVIHVESGGRPEAVSPRGARGLMQIMPDTGEWIAGKLGEDWGYSHEALFEPAVNIEYGCWYLSYLFGKYGDTGHGLMAYNAGPGNVDKWLQNENYAPEGRIETIPFSETEDYVEKVRRAYDKYTELYSQELS